MATEPVEAKDNLRIAVIIGDKRLNEFMRSADLNPNGNMYAVMEQSTATYTPVDGVSLDEALSKFVEVCRENFLVAYVRFAWKQSDQHIEVREYRNPTVDRIRDARHSISLDDLIRSVF